MTVIMTGKPHAPDAIHIISESLFSLFYTALRPNSESKEETSVSGQGFNINASQLFLT
jgi:hypothetical protein